ncbi:TVG1208678 [Thermoplasma volcanium GSS1]|uniref:TVG1208678 protein n=1 Tax=Thermoplasma volcanium (strain ATCC 51530 / DSM 4299 / JCM 9571 / NBRC 15438 / GSS1) TaxID=273116 RepID=Q979I2_THEVO|nr:hypothetical protein [Thermoplasma volcanium]BAB60321.1 TVG1208678 [Thermoplasma volcanium GSS1]
METDQAVDKIKRDLEERYGKIDDIRPERLKFDETLKEYSMIVRFKLENEERVVVYYFSKDGNILRHFNL